ncbi:tetratricopeptide repeat protein [Paenactinomyces guangxiensis]|uniref:Tetratricopeptide repeat protein n=1 Tax=Paenactinomyces guangxiensis TaxID=1490290 RepID=A0A7W1WPM9_9BACL|nr:tetratricopeptide repeat protein [Paenactinomyces guangxiensis]MBA4493752.1 tetratricopeptide repeat protein [Paenactinomyces guangxiensis]MBH8591040.1 tetratricopeptide repeat protein [Paenactinomyces guangxiensis]
MGRAEEAIKTLEQIPLNSPDIQIEAVIGIYDLQAKLKRDINLYDEAVYYAKKGLNLATINFNYERQLELYITLGETYRKAGKLHWAEKCLKAAIMLKDKISWRQFLVLDAYIKLGIVYFEKYDFQLSGKILQKALKIAKKQDDVAKYSQGLLYLAKILLLQSKYEEARAAFTEVYKLHSDQKNDLQALCGLSQVCLSQRDDVNYNKYSKLYFESLKNQKEVISDDGISDSISSFRR